MFNTVSNLLKEQKVDLSKENAIIFCNDGYVKVSLENGHLDIEAIYIDRTIKFDSTLDGLLSFDG
ncbi:hypothetical protein [Bacillus safensis]|uniref:Uncharacterized protein n=1 Tax=Bacillus safensis TaxID=561879 RepID=A0A1L6ZD90_BACIA|nr:hypothetical protein [Bacillus safensis]APT44471.1 hypothetical protein BSA145_00135 [Bacillus safensis]